MREYWKQLSLLVLIFFSGHLFLFAQTPGEGWKLQLLTYGQPVSIRGISVINDTVVWVSGTHGQVGRSTDGGQSWRWQTVTGFDSSDFRSLVAFSDQKAIVINAGAPAHVLLTTDGGGNWKEVYTDHSAGIFFDGMAFWNRRQGIAISDPLNGKVFLIRTRNGGRSWKALPVKQRPAALPGEAFFAASNSILAIAGRRAIWAGSGGLAARVFFSPNRGKKWKVYSCPILQGKPSTGIFSIAFINPKTGIVAGGDYEADSVRIHNAFLTHDGGKTWQQPIVNPFGYRSSVIYCSSRLLIATGSSGTDISTDGGVTWKKLSAEGFNVIQQAHDGREIYLAGAHGEVARLVPAPGKELSSGF